MTQKCIKNYLKVFFPIILDLKYFVVFPFLAGFILNEHEKRYVKHKVC